MKKINKNTKIVLFSFNIVLFISLVFVLLLYIYPEINIIENEKEELVNTKKVFTEEKLKGLAYDNFRKLKTVPVSNYQKKILNKINKDFYNKNFINNGNKYKTYNDFLDNLDEEIKGKLKKDYEKKKDQIYSVMPIYSDYSDDLSQGTLSNFQFVSLIENLLYKNYLSTTSQIGIKTLSKVKEYSDLKNKSDLSSDIYVISLPLKIEGKKKNIINFLNDIYNMGNIHIREKKDGVKDLLFENSDIFTELDSIKMGEYIDSSPSVSYEDKDKKLIDILTKTNQKNELFQIDINLLFYVQGLANYKIKETISNVFGNLIMVKGLKGEDLIQRKELERTNYNSIKKRLQSTKNKYKNDKLTTTKLNKIDSFLESIKSKISGINKKVSQKKDLLDSYEQAQKYKTIFLLISKELDKLEKK